MLYSLLANTSRQNLLVPTAVLNWQVHHWPYSNECKQLIRVLLALRASGWRSALQTMLAQNLPPFLLASRNYAFHGALQDETISQVNLRKSIVEFLALWRCRHPATVRDLVLDATVAREVEALRPKDVPWDEDTMHWWITTCLHGELKLEEAVRGVVLRKERSRCG